MRAPRARGWDLIDRRRFLACGLVGTAAVVGFPLPLGAASPAVPKAKAVAALDPRVVAQLATSPFVYISPLKSNGSESRCHAELWYAWMRDAGGGSASHAGGGSASHAGGGSTGSVAVTVTTQGWKAQSVARGLSRARLWVGDYGRWKGFFRNNEKFRVGSNFVARGEIVKDPGLLERLLLVYETKYPAEIADWRDDMRRGGRDGTRVVIRYTPIQ